MLGGMPQFAPDAEMESGGKEQTMLETEHRGCRGPKTGPSFKEKERKIPFTALKDLRVFEIGY